MLFMIIINIVVVVFTIIYHEQRGELFKLRDLHHVYTI